MLIIVMVTRKMLENCKHTNMGKRDRLSMTKEWKKTQEIKEKINKNKKNKSSAYDTDSNAVADK